MPTPTSLHAYFAAAFPFREPALRQAFHDFLAAELTRGPYLEVKLPFTSVSSDDTGQPWREALARLMPTWQQPYPPYQHQYQAFARLTTRDDHRPQPAILTTGTGSGKTEAFLYPLLDYARQHAERPGIKAIVLYPMNALATDQAKRFAQACDALRRQGGSSLTVGLLIGEGKGKGKPGTRTRTMLADRVIEERQVIENSPPDILLTNFKMLDYALMRDGLNTVWRHNLDQPALLRYLVLDELHTYDGAQGTDVANLIRRLKLRLESQLPEGQRVRLTPVGTSATVGDGLDDRQELAAYAAKLFGEAVGVEAIIGETRVDREALFGAALPIAAYPLPLGSVADYTIRREETFADYQHRQRRLWGLDERGRYFLRANAEDAYSDLGESLRRHPVVALLVQVLQACQREDPLTAPVHLEVLRVAFADYDTRFSDSGTFAHWLRSLLALMPLAKRSPASPPLLYIRSQLWTRELAGVHLVIGAVPTLVWHQDGAAPDTPKPHAAPVWNCRDCGAGGWLVRWMSDRTRVEIDRVQVFANYFANDTKSWFMWRTPAGGYTRPAELRRLESYGKLIDPISLELHEPTDRADGSLVAVTLAHDLRESGKRIEHTCPCCASDGGVSIVGGRKTTMTSVLAGQLLSDPYDPAELSERKVLAFSNAVQDAAHIAGFVESRSYRFTVRNAIVQVLRDRPRALDRLVEDFETHWLSQFRGADAELQYVARFFPADTLGRVEFRSYLEPATRDGVRRFADYFIDELNRRIQWEILSEFGLRADRGRTLLRTGAAGIQLDGARIDAALPELLAVAQAQLGEAVDARTLRRFVVGALHHLRVQGAIDHPFLSDYRGVNWSTFMLNWTRGSGQEQRHFLNPTYGSRGYAPRLVTPELSRRKDHIEPLLAGRGNTLIAYFRRCAGGAASAKTGSGAVALADANDVGRFLVAAFAVLAKAGLVDTVYGKPGVSHALEASALLVSTAATTVHCSVCDYRFAATPEGLEQAEGLPCFRAACTGTFGVADAGQSTYYTDLYANPRSARVYAADHTGMLAREAREALEIDFQQRPEPDSTNVLVATSTLEMGIDIGDLNAVINTMVPPGTSNYLQRIGRAGRNSGSAQVFNIAASSKPHDLYYFAEPAEMMAGPIDTPGCFLEAREILRRHFMALVLDDFTSHPDRAIPRQLKRLKLAERQHGDDWWPHQVRTHLRERGEALLARMRALYLRDVEQRDALEAAFRDVARHLADRSLEQAWMRAFTRAVGELRSLDVQLAAIKKEIDSKSLGQADDRRLALELARRNLTGSRNRLRKRRVLEHLTNQGLLPNYAFPETGVTLEAQVGLPTPRLAQGSLFENEEDRRRLADKRRRKLRSRDFELVRPAGSALREMMPGQTFYTQGYKLPVNSVVIDDFDEQSREFQFCSRCDHLEEVRADTALPELCPKCRDMSFGSDHNRHRYFCPTGVRSYTLASKARIRDDKDDRETGRPLNLYHVHLPDKRGARLLKTIPFGVELNHGVQLRQVHLGEVTPIGGIDYQGEKVSAKGYITCRFCGHATTEAMAYDHETHKLARKPAAGFHLPYCRKVHVAYADGEDDTFAHLYFYHEISTEALRVLLPVSEFDSEEQVALFKSALMLGIRRHFRGRPEHLDLLDYVEYNRDGRPQRFVILYDRVPGGTGYLSQLYERETFNAVLEKAYAQIRDCACQQQVPDRDGCYRCVLSYKFRRPELLSRRRAEELLGRIVGLLDEWEELREGFGEQQIGQALDLIEESELEVMFGKLFRQLALKRQYHWRFERVVDAGDKHYRITYAPEPARELVYRLTPQPSFEDGVLRGGDTRPDFLIALDRAACRGLVPDDAVPVVVYTDGYSYHASAARPNFGPDVAKRAAIVAEGLYLPWTLSYADVDAARRGLDTDEPTFAPDWLADALGKAERDPWFEQDYAPLAGAARDWLTAPNSFLRLLRLLEAGVPREAAQRGVRRALMLLQPKAPQRPAGAIVSVAEAERGLLRGWAEVPLSPPGPTSWWAATALPRLSSASVSLQVAVSMAAVEPSFCLFAHREPLVGYDRASWEEAWQLLDLLFLTALGEPLDVVQDADSALAVTNWSFDRGIDAELAAFVALRQNPTAVDAAADRFDEAAERTAFADVVDTFDPRLAQVFEQLLARRWREQIDYDWGYELCEDGAVAATAELGSARHCFVVDPYTVEAGAVFAEAGYVVFSLDAVDLTQVEE